MQTLVSLSEAIMLAAKVSVNKLIYITIQLFNFSHFQLGEGGNALTQLAICAFGPRRRLSINFLLQGYIKRERRKTNCNRPFSPKAVQIVKQLGSTSSFSSPDAAAVLYTKDSQLIIMEPSEENDKLLSITFNTSIPLNKYNIHKKSREESHGEGSGVEILVNEPYTDGPGGWFRAILPKSALRVEEEAWNAYPYTKTRYKCPFVEKFLLEVETKYVNDPGYQDNVFNLPSTEMKQRQVDSSLTTNHNLHIFWILSRIPYQEVTTKKKKIRNASNQQKLDVVLSMITGGKSTPDCHQDPSKGKSIMTSYKLCRVEFKYWGMQNKIERFIHEIGNEALVMKHEESLGMPFRESFGMPFRESLDMPFREYMPRESFGMPFRESLGMPFRIKACRLEKPPVGLRKTMLRAHRQAWCWQDEWYGLKLSDIRRLERETQLALAEKMGNLSDEGDGGEANETLIENKNSNNKNENESTKKELRIPVSKSFEQVSSTQTTSNKPLSPIGDSRRQSFTSSKKSSGGTRDISTSRIFESLEQLIESSCDEDDDDDEFFDANDYFSTQEEEGRDAGEHTSLLHRSSSMEITGRSILETSSEQASKRSDFSTLKSTFERVMRATYPGAVKQIAFRLVPCPLICSESLNVLSSLSPTLYEAQTPKPGENGGPVWTQEFVPLGAISLFSSSSPDYQEQVNKMVAKANLIYHDFLLSDEGKGFTGNVCLIADSTGALLAYDALSQVSNTLGRGSSQYDSHGSLVEQDYLQKEQARINAPKSNLESSACFSHSDPELRDSETPDITLSEKQLSKSDIVEMENRPKPQAGSIKQSSVYLNVNDRNQDGPCRRTSSGSYYDGTYMKFEFDISDLFMLGSPLGLILAYRRIDPIAARIEPLLHMETVQSNLEIFSGLRRSSVGFSLQRQGSVSSVASQISGLGESTVSTITNVTSRWWGNKRLDYALYCPEVLNTFPSTSFLPHLFHASFWESCDVVAFILRQVVRHDILLSEPIDYDTSMSGSVKDTKPLQKEKWQKRRTTIKVKNLQPNHRGNDVIVCEDSPQTLVARFMYGSYDVTSLTGEKVDVHVMDQSAGEWKYLGTSKTDKHGRLTYTIQDDMRLPQGMHLVKMVVRGDHTSAEFFLTVLPPKTEVVIFSIDGSFTASMSISGKDPKVRAGAVDVVRLYQDLGYLILYVTARPDMQHRKVVSWLAMHNFPHGMVAFMDGLSKEPLKQKLNHLKSLQHEAKVVFSAGYGSSKDIYVYKELVSSGTAKKFFRQGCMSKSTSAKDSKKQLKRLASNPPGEKGDHSKQVDIDICQTRITVSEHGNTVLQPSSEDFGASARLLRGSSPRPKLPRVLRKNAVESLLNKIIN
ncbi:hypothetical protein KUTeg_009977 [Tegillarca granosa]|uniref:DDHD domain-containing protein n=1 Tax=Tegillarca granosa TaxID=220873 RepID=A0ABQ9F5E7_TEGGR|nr:hypothetical protein KUTeg_009977 [Tegillarca granosa]